MRTMQLMLVEFHTSFGATVNLTPTVPSVKDRTMRYTLVDEELGETYDALREKNFPEFVDGLIDSLYVIVGTNVTYGLDVVEPVYGIPKHAPSFPVPVGMSLLDGMLDGMRRVARTVLDPEKNAAPDLAVISMCMNKLVGDCLSILYLCGVDAMHVFAEVHLANMRKLGPDGLPIRREDGKVLKPEGWKPPNIQRVLDDQTRRFDFPVRRV